MKIERGVYTSIWDGGVEISSACSFVRGNDGTIYVECDETADVDGIEILIDERVEAEDGTRYTSGFWDFEYDLPELV